MSDDQPDSVQSEFLAEAQELIESLSRDLLLLDHSQKEGGSDPELVNSIFRAVHTLKGIAGMFGYSELGEVSHHLEELLEHLRLGRVALSQDVLDLMFEGVEVLQRSIALIRNPTEGVPPDILRYKEAVAATLMVTPEEPVIEDFDLDPNVLSVLTEYEEHRLRTNVRQGLGIFRLRVSFPLTSIDSDLEDLKERAKSNAEIITYLPTMEGNDDDSIDLEVILASGCSPEELQGILGVPDESLTEVSRRAGASVRSMPARASSAGPPRKIPSAAPQEMSADALSVRSVTQTVRVDIGKLDRLMNVVGELGIVRGAVARITEELRDHREMRQIATELHRTTRIFERRLEDLQDGILDVRMVPLRQTFDKLARAVRQVSKELRKEVRMVVAGAETEVDKLIVEELTDPLLHIARNAIDHGIETSQDREDQGKPDVGTVAINAYHKGNHVVIEVEDDGRGMDPQRILQSAVARGVVTEESARELSEEEARKLIFLPGMSTTSEVTDLSGRGVGMDVVKTNITRLGGVIDVSSQVGIGSKFTITLPITLAIVSALVLRACGRTYALPLNVVQEALVLDNKAIRRVEDREVLTLRGATLPLCRLEELLQLDPIEDAPFSNGEKKYVVVTSLGQLRLGMVVDALEGQRDVIIKGLGPSLRGVTGFTGATDLGEQRVVLVLDPASIMEEVLSGMESANVLGAGL